MAVSGGDGGAPEFDAKEALEEAYETVNEGETTDTTTSGLDTDGLLAARKQATSESSTDQTSASSKAQAFAGNKLHQEGGIKSSSDSSDAEDGGSTASAADEVEEAAVTNAKARVAQEGSTSSAEAENIDFQKQEELRRLREAATRITSFKEEVGGDGEGDIFGDERNRE